MKLTIDFDKATGIVKPMNAVNNGPVIGKRGSNLEAYQAMKTPYARTHDASFYAGYGGYHTVDVHVVFPDFDADPEDPASYDFQLTDEYMEKIIRGGAKVFYRLGGKIEHESMKYGTLVPPDFHKWAVICEHIIAHMNEGWANGHAYGIEYWEIWNEPDLDKDDASNKRCWQGTAAEFYELFAIAAKHLKARFPHLKIGGPAAAGFRDWWMVPFFEKMRAENVPMDFWSWHCYTADPMTLVNLAKKHREFLDSYGYTGTESICNEWNYVKGWTNENGWNETQESIIGIKGAAFVMGAMSVCQNAPIDMLMYYDARPSIWNGLFDFYTKLPLKPYYSIKAWGELAELENSCAAACDVPEIYAAAASGEGGKMAIVTYFTNNADAVAKTFTVDAAQIGDAVSLYLLDEAHDMAKVAEIYPDEGKFQLTMQPNTVIVLK
ncbi:MAG: hypothetical protein E7632_01060 [Ruminococcaceae bacterium]|nr:hypothetical protein [Oscillospiraceae bacterium]